MTIANEVINSLVLDSDVRLILAGGIVRSGELSMIGHIPLATYQEFNIDKAFVGIAGLSLREGLTEFSLEDALVKRAMLDRAREAILLADGSKFDVWHLPVSVLSIVLMQLSPMHRLQPTWFLNFDNQGFRS